MKTTTDFQLVDVSKLIPYANNARTHNKEQILKLRSSLREFGFVNNGAFLFAPQSVPFQGSMAVERNYSQGTPQAEG